MQASSVERLRLVTAVVALAFDFTNGPENHRGFRPADVLARLLVDGHGGPSRLS